MKKIMSVVLTAAMIVGTMAFAGCGGAKKVSMGLGIVTEMTKATDATAEKAGAGEVDATAVAILVDAEGKVLQMKIDVAQTKPSYTADGKLGTGTDYRSKKQKGVDYGMSKTGKQEWDVQAVAFETLCVGKTVDEIKALVKDDLYGTDDVMKAGCTIKVADFVNAAVKAFEDAKAQGATVDAAATLTLGVSTEGAHSNADAAADKDGSFEVDSTFAAVATKDGKIQKVITDVIQAKFTFDATGKSTAKIPQTVDTKREKKEAYGMSKTGKVEWYLQAAEWDKLCAGKTAAEVAGFVADKGYGNDEVQKAGCTITVSAFAEAVKAAK